MGVFVWRVVRLQSSYFGWRRKKFCKVDLVVLIVRERVSWCSHEKIGQADAAGVVGSVRVGGVAGDTSEASSVEGESII